MSDHPAPRRQGPVAGFAAGFARYADGVRFATVEHRGLLKYCIAPAVIALLLAAGLAAAAVAWGGDAAARLIPAGGGALGGAARAVVWVLVTLLGLAAAYALYLGLYVVVAAPFNDALSERVEALAFGRPPPPFTLRRLLRGAADAALHQAANYGLYALRLLPALLLSWLVPVLSPVTAAYGFYVTAEFFAFSQLDYPMARRQWRFRRKWRALRAHRAPVLGFGAAGALLLMVPVVGVLLLAFAPVGGTLLFGELDRRGWPAPPSTPGA